MMTFNRENLVEAVGDVASVLSRSGDQRFAHVQMSARESLGTVDIYAQGMHALLGIACECEGEITPMVLPAFRFLDAIKAMQGEKIIIQKQKNRVRLTDGTASLSLALVEMEPAVPEACATQYEVMGEDLAQTVGPATTFILTDKKTVTLRPILTGVNVRYKDGMLYFASTDGNAMVVGQVPCAGSGPEINVVIPVESAKIIASKMRAGEVRLSSDNGKFYALLPNMSLISQTIVGLYPDHLALWPQGSTRDLFVETEKLASAVEVASLTTETDTIRLDITKDVLRVSSEAETGESDIMVYGHGARGEDDLSLWISGEYLSQALRGMKVENVTIQFNGDRHPVTLVSEGHPVKMLVMPKAGR